MAHTSEHLVRLALSKLVDARELLKEAGATKAVARVRLAITSGQGALRHARLAPYRKARQAKGGA